MKIAKRVVYTVDREEIAEVIRDYLCNHYSVDGVEAPSADEEVTFHKDGSASVTVLTGEDE